MLINSAFMLALARMRWLKFVRIGENIDPIVANTAVISKMIRVGWCSLPHFINAFFGY